MKQFNKTLLYLFLAILILPFKYSYGQSSSVLLQKVNSSQQWSASKSSCCPTLTLTPHSPVCAGGTGYITSSYSPMPNSVSYRWSTGATSANLYNVTAGTYTLTVTDCDGCRAVECVTLSQPDPICITLTATSPNCSGGNGSITTSVTGGTGSKTYKWSNGATTANLSNVATGTYTVTVSDSKGCTASASKTISQTGGMTIALGATNVSCYGAANGGINAGVSGGSGTKTYRWSNGATTANITGLAPGTYTVTVTDGNGCTASASKTLTQPTQLVVTLTGSNPGCNCAPNGIVETNVSGGTSPYTYKWNTGKTSEDLSGLSAGTYVVTVTDNNHCTATATKTLSQPTNLSATATATNVSCNGTSTGSATATSTGGTAPFTYKWSNNATTATINGLAAGTYSVTITDKNGCTGSTSVAVTQPSALSLSIACTQSTCATGGTVNLTVTGGTTAYTYKWSNGATTQDLSGVAAGTYTVTVTDAKGCTATKSGTVAQPSTLILSATTTSPTCSGNTGAINLTVSGGTAAYTYKWSNGATTQDLSGLAAGTYAVTVTDAGGCTATLSKTLAGGTPVTVVVDTVINVSCNGGSNGSIDIHADGGGGSCAPVTAAPANTCTSCTNTISGSGNITIVAGQKICIVAGTTFTGNINMSGGELVVCGTLNPSNFGFTGGSLTITGSATLNSLNILAGATVSNYGTLNVSTITVAGILNNYATLAVAADLNINASIGLFNNYAQVTVGGSYQNYNTTNNNGIINIAGYLHVNSNSTYNNNCTTTAGNFTCDNIFNNFGSLTIAAQSWLNSGGVFNALTGSSFLTSGLILNSTINGPGSLALVKVTGITIINSGGLISGGIQLCLLLNIQTNNGSILPTVSLNCNSSGSGTGSSTGTYTYKWSNGKTTQDISGLPAGTYTVTVTNSSGCTGTATVTVTQPAPIVLTLNSTSPSCGGTNTGAITLSATGGTAPYTYKWSNNATTQNLGNIAAGTYTVTVTDAKGCTATGSKTVTPGTGALTVSIAVSGTSCGSSAATLNTTVTGGSGSYTYRWSNGATTANLTGVAAGGYSVTVTDASGCTGTASTKFSSQQNTLNISVIAVNACAAANTGGITAYATGGTAPYTYAWTNSGTNSTNVTGRTTNVITLLAPGTYTVTVRDASGCTATAVTNVNITNVTVSPSHDTSICIGASAPLIASGADLYSWSPATGLNDTAIFNPIATPTQTTTYTVTASSFSSNLVYNGDFQLGNAGFTSGYSYVAPGGSMYPEGLYAVDTASHLYHGNFWGHDRTTGHGKYMIVNGAPDSNVVIWAQSVTNILPNTNYYFTTWASSQNTITTYADLAFSINGQLIGPNITSPVDTNHWIQFYAVWNSGSNTSANISIVNMNRIRNGNDFGLDDISFTTVCQTTAQVTVTVNPKPVADAGPDQSICAGGSASLTATGAGAGGTYKWSTGATTATISVSPANLVTTYYVTVTNSSGCTATDSVKVTKYSSSPVVVSIAKTDASCFGTSTATATTTVTGGNAPYTYLWSNGATTANLSNVAAGTYSVTVTSNNGCTGTASTTLTQPVLLTANGSATNVSCFGGSDGTASATAAGGTAPYSFRWSNGASTANITGLIVGTYTVTVTDAKGCSAIAKPVVSQPAPLTLGANTTPTSCNGGSNGSIVLTATGGNPSYTYTWSTGATTKDINNLSAGTYSVTVVDAHSCSATVSILVDQPQPLTIRLTPTNPACNGASTGNITSAVNGGTAPYTFAWSNGATTANPTGLAGGSYTVTVTDANGCSTTGTTQLSNTPALTVTLTTTNITCNGAANGALSATITGGNAPYTYLWSNAATSATITGLGAGTFSLTVTDATGCSGTASTTVTQPATLTLTATATSATCNGSSTGAINLTVTGGTTVYTYLWSNGATTEDLTGLAAGTYTVTVTDANGCSATKSTSVTQPNALGLTAATTQPACNGASTGAINLTVTGGTTAYTYLWSNGATTQDLTGVAAGTYTVTVTDAKGCTATKSATVTQPAALALTATLVNVNCNGASTGAINLAVAGGTTSYSYLWSNGATTQDLTGLTAGTYTVTVTDAKGCSATKSNTITQNDPVVVTLTPANPGCAGAQSGSITTSVVGGAAPYTYLWSTTATSATLSGVGAGTYTVTVTDVNGCSTTANATLTQPTLLSASASATDVSCFGGSNGTAAASATGGTAPYIYLWSNGATTASITGLVAGSYSVTATDARGCTAITATVVGQPGPLTLGANTTPVSCNGGGNGAIILTATGGTATYTYNWSTGATTKDISNLAAGTYSVTVIDAHSCSATVSIVVSQPQPLFANLTPTNPTCGGTSTGSIASAVNGGTSPYTYVWSTGAVTANLTGLAGGSYSVTITDANRCTVSASSQVANTPALTVSLAKTNVTCNGSANGTITTTVTGSTGTVAYQWNNGATTSNRTNLAPGTYTVTVRDGSGCSGTSSAAITQPNALAVTLAKTNVTCNGSATGTVTSTVTGGTAPYTYTWSNGATTASLSGVAAGSYNVTVVDANGCRATSTSVSVTQPNALTNNLTNTNVSCFGGNDGTATSHVTGGTAPYSYQWSNGSTNPSITGLRVGTYIVITTDANGCGRVDSIKITQPGPITLGATTVPVSCNGGANGSIILVAMGPNSPFTYAWSNGSTTKNQTNLSAGSYNVTVTNTNGCKATVAITVLEPQPIVIIPTATSSCLFAQNGTVTTAVSGGTSPYTYAWNNGATTQNLTGLSSGPYSLSLTDAQGCLAGASIEVGDSVCAPELKMAPGVTGAVQTNSDVTATTTVDNASVTMPNEVTVQCYPNPFSATMTVEYQLPKADQVQIAVYDHLGSKIANLVNGNLEAGKYKTSFDSNNLTNGLYYINVQIGDKIITQKAMLMK